MIKVRECPMRVMYILIAAALAISLMITGAPVQKVSASPGLSEWSRVPTPSEEDWVLAPNSTIVDYALASNGTVAYVVVDNQPGYCLLKSNSSAATWMDITSALEKADDVNYISQLLRVATDWLDANFVAVALVENGEVRVYFSTDSGTTFNDVGEVEDGGVYLDYVSGLVVSHEVAGKRDIAIGGIDDSDDAALFRCTVAGDMAGDWEDATAYDGWDDDGDFHSELVTDVIFSPSWATDKTILATTIYGGDTVRVQCGSWQTTAGWNEKSTLGIKSVFVVEGVPLAMFLTSFDARAIAGITLPSDYDSKNSATRMLWVWVNYDTVVNDGPGSEIFVVDNDECMPLPPMGQIRAGDVWLTNISYKGTITEGEAIAGLIGNEDGPVTECCQGVQVYRNDGIHNMFICCQAWHKACKPPTGTTAMAVSYVGEDKAYAVAPQGVMDYDEGAWSVTFDDGDTWNQLSLVDTHIDYLSDVAVSPDCNKTMLVSVNEESGCGCDSVWLHAENLPEAGEYSGKWLRTWCGQLENNYGLLRLAPEETTGDTVYLFDYGTSNVYKNDLETLACWESIGSTELDNIVDLVAKDADTVYALDDNGDVAMFDEVEWYTAVNSTVDQGRTIAVRGDHILVGGCDGDVSYSNNGGETFTELEDVAASGYVTVAFDTYFDTNDTIYAAPAGAGTDNGIYRWIIGQSTEWEDLGAEPYDYTGLVLDRPWGNPMTSAETGGVLYASYVNGGTTGTARCLAPAEDACCDSSNWDYLTAGLTSELFFVMPQALKICGCLTADTSSKLLATDGSQSYDMEKSETGTVWSFEDCYSKIAPTLLSPADGATISADPRRCVNAAFALKWNRHESACLYDIQIALDEDFTDVVVDTQGYESPKGKAARYDVAKGTLPCGVTYFWRVRFAEVKTGQVIHSWWSDPRSFTVAHGKH
jgi:hypothetical protein